MNKPDQSRTRIRKALERARVADRKVQAARRALQEAIAARDRAEARYLRLIPSFPQKESDHG